MKITGFKQESKQEDWIDGCLDRANKLNTFFDRFSSATSSASFSPATSQTDIPSSFDPVFQSHLKSFIFHLGHGPFCIYRFSPKSGDAIDSFPSLSHLPVSGEEAAAESEAEQGCRHNMDWTSFHIL
ncbi:hypothetical protein AMECASPLE_026450 [Ameca splendens]|uniref:Uncharacterized protein n=1 Tax=Ameca splendens TaxID=208324 RepID=A0ABV0XHX3_9TELE